MFPNVKPTEVVGLIGMLSPVSQAAGNLNSGWYPVSQFIQLMAVLQTGTLGASATVDFAMLQAQDAAGTGSKSLSGKSITQIVKATGDDKQAIINFRASDLDTEGGFDYVRMKITVGTAASLVSAALFGINARNLPASDANLASVVQIV